MNEGIQPEPTFENPEDEIKFLKARLDWYQSRTSILNDELRWHKNVIELLSGKTPR